MGGGIDGHALLARAREALAARGDGARAAQQEAYMKSAMPYHGVAGGEVKAVAKEIGAAYAFATPEALLADVATIWDGAAFREERYVALMLAGHARARPLQGLPRTARAAAPPEAGARAVAALDLYERLIVDGAWWDLVDELATHRVRALLAEHPALVAPRLRAWSQSGDVWLRRAAIIAQVGRKDATDKGLLEAAMAPALEEKVFWLRKAIGWALRDLARTDPAWVLAYVEREGGRMSGLSRREALKHVGAGGGGQQQ
ncbi:MAG: DNA alkylation repair protein [Myxococcales bacterium]|nr:DNA alkylation repair protein [Myxococcales bacterium]